MDVNVILHLSPTFSAFVHKIDAVYVHNNVASDYEFRENRILTICTHATRFG